MSSVPSWAPFAGAAVGLASAPVLRWLATQATTTGTAPSMVTVVVLAVLTGVAGSVWPLPLLLAGIPLFVLGLPAAAVDLHEHRLPNRLTIPLIIGALITIGAVALLTGQGGAALRAAAGATGYAGFLLVQFAISASTGPGDIKYAAGLGVYLGWAGWTWLLAGMLAAYLISLLGVAAIMIARRRRIRGPVPLGPGMYTGAILALTAATLTT